MMSQVFRNESRIDHLPPSNFHYTHWLTTNWEKDFNYYDQRRWLSQTTHYPVIICVAYLMTIFSLQRFMEGRQGLKLKYPLILWNMFLASFSIIGTIRTVGYNLTFLLSRGLPAALCEEQPINSGPYALWVWLFIVSKVPELGDTIFIVLRKQKLIFLHWFHHCSVLVLVWVSNSEIFSIGGYFLSMNYIVHSIMYSYYLLKALGIGVPKQLAMSITCSQILQMIVGTSITFYAFREVQAGRVCETHPTTIYLSLFLYVTYLFLFADFFIRSYLRSTKMSWKNLSPFVNAFFDYLGMKVHVTTSQFIIENNNDNLGNNNERRMTEGEEKKKSI